MTDMLSVVARAIHFTLFPHLPERMFDTDARHRQHLCDTAKAAIEAHETALEAEGLVIVPREPSRAMMVAGIDAAPMGRVKYDDGGALGKWVSYDTDQCAEIYKAMLAALEGKDAD